MALEWYTLKHRKPVKTDVFTAAALLSQEGYHKRRIRLHREGSKVISTVFLPLGQGIGAPYLFETAVFYNDEWRVIQKHHTHREAIKFHRHYRKLIRTIKIVR